MPRERKAPKFKAENAAAAAAAAAANTDMKLNLQPPESPSTKKRKGTNVNNTPPTLPDLVPPPPNTGFGETIVARNPFDDTMPGNVNVNVPPPLSHPPQQVMAPNMNPANHHMNHMPPHQMPPQMMQHNKPVPMSSGKIYPPDQPMVFNPQNPNAPPIYPCGICHKEVHDNDQAILCESGCNFWFHRICTGLTEASYHLLTAEVYAEWVCDKCLSSKNIPLVKMKP